MIICAIVNVHRRKEDGALQPADVMPWLRERTERQAQSAEEMRRMLEEITIAMGGIVHPRHRPLAGA